MKPSMKPSMTLFFLACKVFKGMSGEIGVRQQVTRSTPETLIQMALQG